MDANRGYQGWSLSNRAAEAYEAGEKPISKIGRADRDELLAKLRDLGVDTSPFDQITVKDFRRFVRRFGFTSWHHTSKEFNRTDFYSAAAAVADCETIAVADLDHDRLNPHKVRYLAAYAAGGDECDVIFGEARK